MSVKGIYWFLQVCLQCILNENLCIGELWKILGVCKMSTGKYDVYRQDTDSGHRQRDGAGKTTLVTFFKKTSYLC
jgi:hypothetical protein